VTSSLIGQTLGNYKIVDLLGHGGMATVYRGYQEAVDRRVAIKVLPPHPALDAQFVERFQLEARTIANLQHPHILPLYDYGVQDEILYFVMAYIDGGTLEDRLRKDDPLTLSQVERVLREVAGALDYAHRRGIIHRDIKPGNILLDEEGHALLADFGIAKIAGGSSQLTGTGVVGTPAYMAPEQAQGAGVDARADIYALGVVVYQTITGRQPFTADTPMQVMLKVIQEPVPDIHSFVEGLPEGLSHVMARVLAKDPADRYQSATEFAEAFSRSIHTGADSLAAVQAATPLESKTEKMTASQPAATQQTTPTTDTGSQMVIVNQNMNPLVLLAGFGIIALALVVVIVLVLNASGGSTPATVTDPGTTVADSQDDADSEETDPEPTSVEQVAVPRFGRVSYSTSSSLGDSVSVRVENLRPPQSGMTYAAWLLNTSQDTRLHLGNLNVDAIGSGVLSFVDPDGRLLPAYYNTFAISLEERGFSGDSPTGDFAYSSSVPEEIADVLRAIFVESEDGLNGGSLLAGAKTEANFAAQHAGLASRSTNIGGLHLHTEHTINILRGETVDYNGDGRGENPGRGVGVYAFLDMIEEKLSSAVNVPDGSIGIQRDAEFIRVCLENTRVRADRVVELGLMILESTDFDEVLDEAEESTAISEQMQTGYDLNQNDIIEPFEGECGLNQIEDYGILFGGMDILAGPLTD
jgi:serine/threonine protein kinase